jgi:hypothetical protein
MRIRRLGLNFEEEEGAACFSFMLTFALLIRLIIRQQFGTRYWPELNRTTEQYLAGNESAKCGAHAPHSDVPE